MPAVIDGNNLLFAARAAEGTERSMGRSMLCSALGAWAKCRGESVHVVFDGPAPPNDLAEQIGDARIRVSYSGDRTADAVVIGLVDSDSAARRLLVVSSDREVIRAAKRRRARAVRSQDFWAMLQRDVARPPSKPLHPPEKRRGIGPEETERWLREFGLDGHNGKDAEP